MDVHRVDVARVPEDDTVLPDPHGVLVQVGDAVGDWGVAPFLD